MSALEEEVACYNEVACPRARPGGLAAGGCATAQFRRGGSPVVWGCWKGPRVNDRRVDEHGSGAGRRAGPCRRTCVPRRKSRRCCWCGICGLSTVDLRPALETLIGEDAVGLSATNIGQLTAVCGMLGGVGTVSQTQPGWMPVRIRVGEGGAIRCRSQTDLDTPSVEYPVQPQLRTRPTVTTTHPQHGAAIAT